MMISRRDLLTLVGASMLAGLACRPALAVPPSRKDPKVVEAVKRGLDFLAREQRRQGYWEATGGPYRVAMTSLAANALACEGSTTTRGKYADNIKLAVDYLVELANPSTGLIGYSRDYHYTYGHGFSMLFLSQIYGEEEDAQRREDLRRVLTKAVEFSVGAQTPAGGWGYVSQKDQPDFDEGSTCVTQVQGLRACRNAGIPVPKESIERAVEYIKRCTSPDGGVQYSIRGGGERPAITAAAIASLFNAGEYDNSEYVKKLLALLREERLAGQLADALFRPLALHALLLRAGHVPLGRREVEPLFRQRQQRDRLQAVPLRRVEGRPVRRRLSDRHQPHHPAARQRLLPIYQR